MFVAVDIENSQIEGFKFTNEDGNEEFVKIVDHDENSVYTYSTDIPKLIKALQAAYDYIQPN